MDQFQKANIFTNVQEMTNKPRTLQTSVLFPPADESRYFVVYVWQGQGLKAPHQIIDSKYNKLTVYVGNTQIDVQRCTPYKSLYVNPYMYIHKGTLIYKRTPMFVYVYIGAPHIYIYIYIYVYRSRQINLGFPDRT